MVAMPLTKILFSFISHSGYLDKRSLLEPILLKI